MKTLFQIVKEEVSVPEAARLYGLEPGSSGMVRCPFHDDRTPSLKLYPDHYYCFGCHAHGDVTDLVAGLTRLRPVDAARLLAGQFRIASPDAHFSSPKSIL